jgi:hypothetical protein
VAVIGVCVAAVAATSALAAGYLAHSNDDPTARPNCGRLHPTPESWRAASTSGHPSERQALAIRIEKCRVLRGRTPAAVRRLIGRPDHVLPATPSDPEEWEWFTGGERDRPDKSTSLVIQFDRRRHAAGVFAGD